MSLNIGSTATKMRIERESRRKFVVNIENDGKSEAHRKKKFQTHEKKILSQNFYF